MNELFDRIDKTIEIQGQTRLLLLNALVEAARAGESGKDLALTVSEIKELTSRRAESL